MILLEFSGKGLEGLVLLIFLFWLIPIIMLLVGLFQLKSKPERSKGLIIFAGIWLVIGVGACGSMLS